MKMVKQEKRTDLIPIILKAPITMRPSIINITIPIFMQKVSDNIWANKSVPPVLVWYRSIIPTPKPMKIPPNNTLGKIESKNWFLKGPNQSILIETIIKPRKLL